MYWCMEIYNQNGISNDLRKLIMSLALAECIDQCIGGLFNRIF